MFEGFSQLTNLMKQLPRLREQAAQMQQRVSEISVEGDAGAGMVKTKVNGRMELTTLTISEEAWKLNDREMVEDLVKSAVNQALERARVRVAEETQRLAKDMGMPELPMPGMG